MPFLNDKTRAMVAGLVSGRVPQYLELREILLTQLRMTANEYTRRLHASRREEGGSWLQFSSKRDVICSDYRNSLHITPLDDLCDLTISCRLRQ